MLCQHNKSITTADLQGGWSQTSEFYYDYSNQNMDSRGYTVRVDQNWWIQGDSIFSFKYPCAYLTGIRFRVEHDSIYYGSNKNATAHLRFDGVKLVMTGTNPSEQDNMKIWYKEDYNEKIVNLLKRDSLNPDCIIGKMELLTAYFPSNGESEENVYPVKLPKHLTIRTLKKAHTFYKKKTITLKVEGKKRLFYVDVIYWNRMLSSEITSYNTVINLRPAAWWKGEGFIVQYHFMR